LPWVASSQIYGSLVLVFSSSPLRASDHIGSLAP
jgi:hypothetical protein